MFEQEKSETKVALILVDVINSFYKEGMPNYYPRALDTLVPISELLTKARQSGKLVVHAVERHYPGMEDFEFRKLPKHHMIGDDDTAFFEGFEPGLNQNEVTVGKRRFSAFFGTDLGIFLHEQKITDVIVAGVKTNVCIRATCQDAFAWGFNPIVPREATNSNRTHLEEASLEDINRYMGEVVTLEEALKLL